MRTCIAGGIIILALRNVEVRGFATSVHLGGADRRDPRRALPYHIRCWDCHFPNCAPAFTIHAFHRALPRF